MVALKQKIYDFLETPTGFLAIFFRFFIIILILLSAGIAIIHLTKPNLLSDYDTLIYQFELFALGIFTLEFLLRFWVKHSFKDFCSKPSNWIDFLAIAPFYMGIDNATLLRIFRVLRLLKLIKSVHTLQVSNVFNFKHSILKVVSPLIITLVGLKAFFLILESQKIWVIESNFDTLFTVIGFALGVVLSQKVGTSFAKYIDVQDALYRLHGKLASLQCNLNIMKKGQGDIIVRDWLRTYLKTYHGPIEGSAKNTRIINEKFYNAAAKIGNTDLIPFHRLAAMMALLFEESIYIQSKKTNRTPAAYNILLQQTTLIYLILLLVFIPGMKGFISVIFAGYLLYGMYHITNDFDDVRGFKNDSKNNLIHIDTTRIHNYLEELESIKK